ncbi:MAG: Mur ligase family protein [Candidatus Coproplasma sp.]
MGIFVSPAKTAECVVIAVLFAVAMLLTCAKPLGILQSCGYSGKKLMRWAKKKNNLTFERYCLLALCCALCTAVISLCFSFAGEWAAVIGLAAYVIFYALYIVADSRLTLRSPATLTPRFMRLMAVVWLVCAIAAYIIVTLLNFADYCWGNAVFTTLRYLPLCILPVLSLPLVCLANLISKLYETPRNRSYIKKAKAKLAGSDIKIIGITGSYGKTSAKNILTAMLSQKYRVLSTPRSHNTPLGVSLTVNDNDLENYDILIVEMGARHVGDVAELCAICPPDYSVITGICPQHLESFGTVENIIKAKGEILTATKNCTVIAPDCYEDFAAYDVNKIKGDCVKDIVATCKGTQFTLCIGGEEQRVSTKLLGAHSAENIALCAACAAQLGVSLTQISKAVEELDFVEHRLQLIESNGVHILDDGYNSNVKGAAAAVEVLNSFEGRRIVVTPGLVELGVLDEDENRALGARLVGLDWVILVGDTLVGFVKEGYVSAGGDASKLILVPSLVAAQDKLKDIIQKGDAVLFLNDLPDMYN